MSATSAAWPRGIYSTSQVREFDRFAIETLGIEGFELMRRAAQAALRFLQARWPQAESLLIYCGAGNNAGDGYVLATLAKAEGMEVRLVGVIEPERLRGDAARAAALARRSGIEIEPYEPDPSAQHGEPDLIVDALLGTGLTRDVAGRLAAAVEQINAAAVPILALDVPTGLDADTGQVRGVAVRASATITFVGLKSGLYLGAGPAYRGEIGFSALDLPEGVFAQVAAVLARIELADAARLLPPRSRIAHKGLNGRVLVVGGAVGMSGAARLAAEAALRTGAGLVQAAVAPESVSAVMAGRPEIMCTGVCEPGQLAELCAVADTVVVGPGLGRSRWSEQMAAAVFASARPLIVDADALNYLAQHRGRRDDWVLTPHPGEAARLLGCTSEDVQSDRRLAVMQLVDTYGGIAVLKGACSLVAQAAENTEPSVAVCDYGNPGMATGGMGDVLAGALGGLVGQCGLSAAVVECGVLVHAVAGDDAARQGERGMLASDLLAHLRRRVNPT
jgi:hydroxyethylthiazole kinase-like uncharacterized protein yjeF